MLTTDDLVNIVTLAEKEFYNNKDNGNYFSCLKNMMDGNHYSDHIDILGDITATAFTKDFNIILPNRGFTSTVKAEAAFIVYKLKLLLCLLEEMHTTNAQQLETINLDWIKAYKDRIKTQDATITVPFEFKYRNFIDRHAGFICLLALITAATKATHCGGGLPVLLGQQLINVKECPPNYMLLQMVLSWPISFLAYSAAGYAYSRYKYFNSENNITIINIDRLTQEMNLISRVDSLINQLDVKKSQRYQAV